MNKYFTLIILFTYHISFSQNKQEVKKDSLVWVKMTCEKGIKDAKIDFNNGIYKCYSYGLIAYTNSYDKNFEQFLFEYRKNKYGIISKNAGCVTTAHSKCYQETMINMVYKKYGPDIFEKSRKEAEELYSKKQKH